MHCAVAPLINSVNKCQAATNSCSLLNSLLRDFSCVGLHNETQIKEVVVGSLPQDPPELDLSLLLSACGTFSVVVSPSSRAQAAPVCGRRLNLSLVQTVEGLSGAGPA